MLLGRKTIIKGMNTLQGIVFKVQGIHSLVYELGMTVSDRNANALLQLPQKERSINAFLKKIVLWSEKVSLKTKGGNE